MLSDVLEYINSCVSGPGLAAVIFVCGVVLFARLGPFAIVHPRRTLTALEERQLTEWSPAKAMCVALAGTLGVGNIAGVASAIYIRRRLGARFWMWVSALAAMPIKYAETVLALGHRAWAEGGWLARRGVLLYHGHAAVNAVGLFRRAVRRAVCSRRLSRWAARCRLRLRRRR